MNNIAHFLASAVTGSFMSTVCKLLNAKLAMKEEDFNDIFSIISFLSLFMFHIQKVLFPTSSDVNG